MTYHATAVLSPSGADISWLPPTEGSAKASIVALVDELRALAQRTPAGEATVLVQNMNERAQYETGKVTQLTVDAVGTPRFTPATADEWTVVVNGPATPTAVQDPLPTVEAVEPQLAQDLQPRTHQPDPIGMDQLFSQSFSTRQAQCTTLPAVTVAVANTKGGAGKTPLAIIVVQAAAALAGHNDLALIDINPSGNLSEHTLRSSSSNIVVLASEAAARPDFGRTRLELDPYLNWQPGGWVTINCPSRIVTPEGDIISDLTGDDIGNIVTALRNHCRFLLFDTGNNAKDQAWQAALRSADKILIPVSWDPDTLIEAQKMVTNLSLAKHERLKERIIFVGTHAPTQRPNRKRERTYRAGLESSGWRVMDLPPDKHIAEGSIIVWDKLRKRTQDAATAIVEALMP